MCGCGYEMRVEENGVTLNVHTSANTPYYLIQADKWRCRSCEAFAYIPAQAEFAIHIHPDYDEMADKANAIKIRLIG
jgi:hypothetical protein